MSDWPIVVPAQLVSGRLKVNRPRLAKLLARRKDCELELVIERKHATRSLHQNAWYWAGVIQPIADYTGYTPEETHELLKARFLPKRLAIADGNGVVVDEVVIGGSTTKLNKIQFGEYVEEIRRWAGETLAITIHDPLPLERVS